MPIIFDAVVPDKQFCNNQLPKGKVDQHNKRSVNTNVQVDILRNKLAIIPFILFLSYYFICLLKIAIILIALAERPSSADISIMVMVVKLFKGQNLQTK